MQNICKKCGNLMLSKILDYKSEHNGREILIKDVQGLICPKCGDEVLSERGEEQLKTKLLEERLVFIKKEKLQPILISNIKNIRIKNGFSQSQLGSALNVTAQRYGVIERNDNTPTILTGYQIADLLGASPNETYKLHYITNELYEKIINLKLIMDDEEDFRFVFIDKAKETREKLLNIRKEIKQLNNLKATLKKQRKNNEINQNTFETKLDKIEKQKKKFNTLRTKIDAELREIEKELLIKQGNIIDKDDWEKLIKIYKEAEKKIV